MVVEICSLGDVGKYTGVYYTFSMAAQIFTPIFSGFLMQHISYRVLFPYACVFTILAMITMCMVKHGDSKPQAKKKVWEDVYKRQVGIYQDDYFCGSCGIDCE